MSNNFLLGTAGTISDKVSQDIDISGLMSDGVLELSIEHFHTFQDLYKYIAENIHNAYDDRSNSINYLQNIYYAIPKASDIDEGRFMIYILDRLKNYYNFSVRNYYNLTQTIKFVAYVNKYTTLYYGNLTDFVCGIGWDNGCVPNYWVEFSADAGYDVSGWPICS